MNCVHWDLIYKFEKLNLYHNYEYLIIKDNLFMNVKWNKLSASIKTVSSIIKFTVWRCPVLSINKILFTI